MKVDHLCQIRLTYKQVLHLVSCELDMHANEHIPGSEEHTRLKKMSEAVMNEHSHIDTTDDGIIVVVDGVSYTETFE